MEIKNIKNQVKNNLKYLLFYDKALKLEVFISYKVKILRFS